jgi:uncharacterized membrane protein YfcA
MPEDTPLATEERRSRRSRAGLDAGSAGIGLGGGFFSGLLGVGGGVVMVPLLVLIGKRSQREAHAISLGAIVPIGIAGVLTFGAAGEVRVPEAIALTAGALLGAQVGARALARAPERTLKLVFGCFLLAVAVLLPVLR